LLLSLSFPLKVVAGGPFREPFFFFAAISEAGKVFGRRIFGQVRNFLPLFAENFELFEPAGQRATAATATYKKPLVAAATSGRANFISHRSPISSISSIQSHHGNCD